ncbi:MAG: (2Fe-2S)-binding protein [Anaerolineales bacterium]|nr:(2Fe-2S)-binding protein [Anaerolineales bacterium]
MSLHTIKLEINGVTQTASVEGNLTLLELLRERIGLTGTKNGCFSGECGACTVMMNGEPVNSCMVLAVEADRARILTVEGLAANGRMDALQEAFIEKTGTQCGFCTPGMLISARALLDRNPDPSEEEIKQALRGHLCRCTGYIRIIQAVKKAAALEGGRAG